MDSSVRETGRQEASSPPQPSRHGTASIADRRAARQRVLSGGVTYHSAELRVNSCFKVFLLVCICL